MEKILPQITKKRAPKTFINDSKQSYISKVLKDHGWTEVPNSATSWHLKWTWKTNLKEIEALQNSQLINHFEGTQEIATKLGLSLLLKRNQTITNQGRCYSDFYPRSYNLISEEEEFLQDFIHTGILNLLKKIVACIELYYQDQFISVKELSKMIKQNSTHECLKQILQNQEVFTIKKVCPFKIEGRIFLRLLFYLEHLFSLDSIYDFQKQELVQMAEYANHSIPFTGGKLERPTIKSLALLLRFHEKCLKYYPAYFQDGFGNVWILKSNYSSRGRNIQLVDSLNQVRQMSNGMKLIQKYLENVWILHSLTEEETDQFPFMKPAINRKFDLRFWVLVKSFNPLQVYFYEEGYLRLSSQNYKLDTLKDNNVHLTNFSTNWKKNKLKQIGTDNTSILFSDFLNFINYQTNFNHQTLKNKIKNICLETIKTAEFKQSHKCFQLLGFDIILDAKLNPWLLQCNMSPSCSPRGKLKNLAVQMATGMFSILGLIDSPTYQWSTLIQQNIGTQNQKNKNSIFSNLDTKDSFTVRPLKLGKYQRIQKVQLIVEKISKIQIFIKQRFAQKQNQYKPSTRCVRLLEILALVTKKKVYRHLKTFMKRMKKIRIKYNTQQ